jgi:hypothetical protein
LFLSLTILLLRFPDINNLLNLQVFIVIVGIHFPSDGRCHFNNQVLRWSHECSHSSSCCHTLCRFHTHSIGSAGIVNSACIRASGLLKFIALSCWRVAWRPRVVFISARIKDWTSP